MSSHSSKEGGQQQDYTPEEQHSSELLGAPHYQYTHQQHQVTQRPVLSNYYRHYEDYRNPDTTNENRLGHPELAKHPLNSRDQVWARAPQASQLYSQHAQESSSSSPFRQQPLGTTGRIPEHIPPSDHNRKDTDIDDSDGLNSQLSQLPLEPEIVKEMLGKIEYTYTPEAVCPEPGRVYH